ncbi:glycerophosphodiester phosphodiesterase [Natronococcus pandeyae]|uniref:Glycerophosphodiester phosphodiesterase n=2 Tax=Natronococcus pandeyae TaxID=2055836 RepID=A0A8J8Q190_9EURY|nr:glycerophosphodiester phosphodiesterase [Natronococcus pandeyae]
MGDRKRPTRNVAEMYRRRFARMTGASLGVAALGSSVSARHESGNPNDRPTIPESRFPDGTDREEPTLVAHRCFAGYFPENTLAAMEGACHVGDGASPYTLPDRVEIDLLPTREETVVVFHDQRLDDLTDESGVVWLEDDETVLNAEVLKSGETIPTLREALETIPEWMPVQLDIKSPGATAVTDSGTVTETSETARYRQFISDVFDVVEEFEHDYVWSSFEDDALAAVKEFDPDQPIMYLWADDNERGYESARRLDAEAVGPSVGSVDRDLVERAHRDGREVYVYTVTQWHESERLRRIGVDHVISDYPRMRDFGRAQGFGTDGSEIS